MAGLIPVREEGPAMADPATTASSVPASLDAGARRDRPPTIRDVAELAGVATSTVSRALARPDRVNPRTRARIEEAAAELNYVPSSQARRPSAGRTNAVSALAPDTTHPLYFDIVRGSPHQLKAAGVTQL